MKPVFFVFAMLGWAASMPALAESPDEFREIRSCPEEFPVAAIKLSPLPAGWVGITPPVLLLTSADLLIGPPDRPGMLIGKRKKTRDGYKVTFEYRDTNASRPDQKWLACRYGTDLALAQRLPDKTDRCVISYNRDGYNGHDIQFACHVKP